MASSQSRRRFLKYGVMAAVAAGLAGVGLIYQYSPKPVKTTEMAYVRVGAVRSASYVPIHIAEQKGYFDEQGITIIWNEVPAQQQMLGLSHGELDVGAGCIQKYMFDAFIDQMDFKAVADMGQNAKGFSYQALIVRKELYDNGLRSTEDLKGRDVATCGIGYPVHYLLLKDLERNGVVQEDLNIVFRGYESQVEGLNDGSIDAAWCSSAYYHVALDISAMIAKYADEVEDGVQGELVWYSGDFIREKRETAVKWMAAYLKAVRFYNDPANKEEVIKLLTEFTGMPETAFRTYYEKRSWIYFALDGMPIVENLKAQQEFWTKQGQLKGPPTPVEQWLDPSFVEEANEIVL